MVNSPTGHTGSQACHNDYAQSVFTCPVKMIIGIRHTCAPVGCINNRHLATTLVCTAGPLREGELTTLLCRTNSVDNTSCNSDTDKLFMINPFLDAINLLILILSVWFVNGIRCKPHGSTYVNSRRRATTPVVSSLLCRTIFVLMFNFEKINRRSTTVCMHYSGLCDCDRPKQTDETNAHT